MLGAEAGSGAGLHILKMPGSPQHLACRNSAGQQVALSDGAGNDFFKLRESRKLAIPFVITVRKQNPSNHMFVTTGNGDVKWLYHQTELGLKEILRPVA